MENAPFELLLFPVLCVGGWLETSLLKGNVTPGCDEFLIVRFLYLHPPRPDLKSKRDGPAQFFGRKDVLLHLEWLQIWALSDSPQNQD